MSRYEIWRQGILGGWSHHPRDTYRWRWYARLVAEWRNGAGWTQYEVRERA